MRTRTLVLLGWMVCIARPAAGDELVGSCIIVDPPNTGRWLDESEEPALELALGSGMQVGPNIRIETKKGNRAALYLRVNGKTPSAEASVNLEANTAIQVCPKDDARRRVHVLRGFLVVRYVARDGKPFVLTTDSGWALLERGTLVATVAGKKVSFALAAGKARSFDGKLGADVDPAKAPDGKALEPQADALEAAGKLRRRLNGAMALAATAAWLGRAERGDLIPMPKRPEAMAPAVAALAVEAAPVDQPPQVSPVTVGETTSPVTGGLGATNQAQSLLASGDPASVIVGARLERTRIVGNPGTAAAGTGMTYNKQARGPLTLTSKK